MTQFANYIRRTIEPPPPIASSGRFGSLREVQGYGIRALVDDSCYTPAQRHLDFINSGADFTKHGAPELVIINVRNNDIAGACARAHSLRVAEREQRDPPAVIVLAFNVRIDNEALRAVNTAHLKAADMYLVTNDDRHIFTANVSRVLKIVGEEIAVQAYEEKLAASGDNARRDSEK